MLYVNFSISGIITVPIDTSNPSRAKWKASNELKSIISSSLLPDMHGVTYEIIQIKDELGNIITDY